MKVPATWLNSQADVPLNAVVTGEKFLSGFMLGSNTFSFWPLVSNVLQLGGFYGGAGVVANSWFDARRSALSSSQYWQLKNVQVIDTFSMSPGGGAGGMCVVMCEFKRIPPP